jgi:hypothetical protein
MWKLVVLDPDGYIFNHAETFANLALDATGVEEDEEMDEEAFRIKWNLFVDQVWSSTAPAMLKMEREIPPEIGAFLEQELAKMNEICPSYANSPSGRRPIPESSAYS